MERSGARLAVITAEAGGGKTRLAAEFAESLPERWGRLTVGGHRTERSPATALELLLGAVPDAGDPALSLAHALAASLSERASAAPLAVVIEDLHWLDPVVTIALPHLLAELGSVRVFVVTTYRLGSHAVGSPHSRALAAALRHPASDELRPAPLSLEAAGEMHRAMRGDEDPELAARLFERTGGNPFFLEELLRSPGHELPWTVAEAVHERVTALEPDARRLATILTLAAEPLPVDLVARIDPDAAAAANALVHAALATYVAPGVLGLHHALVADVLRDTVPPAERSRLHRTLATELETRRGSVEPVRLARHWREAGDREQAARWALVAADRLAGQRAYHGATELYRVALAMPPANPIERAAVFERAAGSAAVAEEDADARAWAAEARRAYDDAGQRARAVSLLVNPGLQRLADAAGEPAAASSAPALLLEAQGAMRAGDHERARCLALQAYEAATLDGDTIMRSTSALTLANAGDLDGGGDLLERMATEAIATGDHLVAARVLLNAARPVWVKGDVASAVRISKRALTEARRVPDDTVRTHVLAGLILAVLGAGELGEAAALTADLGSSDDPVVTGISMFYLSVLDLERGDVDGASTRIDALVAAIRAMGIDFYAIPVLATAARIALVRDDPRRALALVDEAERASWSPFHEMACDLLVTRGRAAARLADAAELSVAAEAAADLARSTAGTGPMAAADLLAGLVLNSEARWEEASERFATAARAWERAPRWLFAAEAWCDAAASAMRAGLDAAPMLARAHEISGRHGLRLVAVRAAALGEASPVPAVELSMLTPRERDIVRLVATGSSNREIGEQLFLSEKTVRNYLSSAFAKLGVTRRAEVAALVARLG